MFGISLYLVRTAHMWLSHPYLHAQPELTKAWRCYGKQLTRIFAYYSFQQCTLLTTANVTSVFTVTSDMCICKPNVPTTVICAHHPKAVCRYVLYITDRSEQWQICLYLANSYRGRKWHQNWLTLTGKRNGVR